jgi:hypothetical protein
MLKREDGARFKATIQTTSHGLPLRPEARRNANDQARIAPQVRQAAYVVGLQADDHTLTETDVQLFANKESAEA